MAASYRGSLRAITAIRRRRPTCHLGERYGPICVRSRLTLADFEKEIMDRLVSRMTDDLLEGDLNLHASFFGIYTQDQVIARSLGEFGRSIRDFGRQVGGFIDELNFMPPPSNGEQIRVLRERARRESSLPTITFDMEGRSFSPDPEPDIVVTGNDIISGSLLQDRVTFADQNPEASYVHDGVPVRRELELCRDSSRDHVRVNLRYERSEWPSLREVSRANYRTDVSKRGNVTRNTVRPRRCNQRNR